MPKVKVPETEGPRKKIYLKVKVGPHTEYKAFYNGLEIEGYTMGDKNDVKDIVRRIILAVNDPPEIVVRAVILVANHIVSAVHSGAKDVWGGIGVEFGQDESLKVGASLYYYIDDDADEMSGWTGEVSATFSGYDGVIVDGVHKVVRKVDFGENIDAVGLYRELLKVSRHAYNAWLTE